MESNFFAELKKYFEKFPGIGPRQASRFIWALSDFPQADRENFGKLIASLGNHLARCAECYRIFSPAAPEKKLCSFCAPGSRRDQSSLMVLEKDSDLLNIEKASFYRGLYHVLGGTLDALNEDSLARERIKALHARLAKRNSASLEIILALPPTKLGEFTSEYIKKVLEPLNIKITRLGRGLSTGVDLEYADELTLKQAIDNRK
ncbi:recombination protein RecR [Candidatus Giovannonibacteria bacterium]|nr:recombination protein RecR [Candidatus Giovannonibacteria bacterium]